MTLNEAKQNVGALTRIYFRPINCTCGVPLVARPDDPEDARECPKCKQVGRHRFVQILEVRGTSVKVLMEDFRRDKPLWISRRLVPGDGYLETLELIEAPRARPGVQRSK